MTATVGSGASSRVGVERAGMDPRLRARRVEVLRRRGRRRLRLLLVMLLLISGAVALIVLSRSELFDVDVVAVRGAHHTGADAVRDAAAIAPGAPLVDLDLGAARERIAALPWVDDVRSDRAVDGTVTFHVTERVVAAALRSGSAWALADPAGRVLATVADPPAEVPIIDADVADAEPGGWLPAGALPAVQAAALLPSGLASRVERLATTPLTLELPGGARVLLGDTSELDRKYLVALTIMSEVSLTCGDVVDVQVPTAPFLTNSGQCP